MYRHNLASRTDYNKTLKSYKQLCKQKKEEEAHKILQECNEIKSEKEMWKWLRGWKQKRYVVAPGGAEEWRAFFKEKLRGSETYSRDSATENCQIVTETISETETRQQISKLKLRKAAGVDNIPNEAWKYAPSHVVHSLVNCMNEIYKSGNLPID